MKAASVTPAIHVPVWEPHVTLTLSQEEAQALYDVTGAVGGHAEKTRRRYISDAPGAIRDVLRPFVDRKNSNTTDKDGTIWFK